jgi:hypothetical protein
MAAWALGTSLMMPFGCEPTGLTPSPRRRQGVCTASACPYLHVNVNPDAPVCQGFVRGFCATGEACVNKHTLVCQPFAATGVCPNRTRCRFHHPASHHHAAAGANSTRESESESESEVRDAGVPAVRGHGRVPQPHALPLPPPGEPPPRGCRCQPYP